MHPVPHSGGLESVAFKRYLVLPGLVLTACEVAFIVWPGFGLFAPTESERALLLRAGAPILAGAAVMWFAAIASWLAPIHRAIQLRRRGEALPKDLAAAAYRATWALPLRASFVRTLLWLLIGLALGLVLRRYGDWGGRRVAQLAAMTSLHGLAINLVRAVWYAHICGAVRERLFPDIAPLRQFADGYFRRLVHIGVVVGGAGTVSVAAFAYYVMRLPDERYLDLQVYLPSIVAGGTLVWMGLARYWVVGIDAYLRTQATATERARVPGITSASEAQQVYRRAQELPYRLSGATVLVWVAAALALALVTRLHLEMELDDAVLMFGITAVMSVGVALYQGMWHRDTMRPLLGHLTVRHRLPMRGIRTSLSLRAKLLLSFGGVVLFACGLALFWGFIQYKNLVTGFSSRQADLGLAWLRSEVQASAAAAVQPPDRALAERVLLEVDMSTAAPNAVYYFQGAGGQLLALGGGPMGAPKLPWYSRARLQLQRDGAIKLGSLGLSGRHGRLLVDWQHDKFDLGALAVFLPSYAGRGPTIERPLKELLVFFLALFGLCGGIAVLTVGEFVKPIRKLEQRADGMARGELAQPVTSGGESDEIGRLTYALEEMRRALGEKLRSTEEVNLDLERAVQRRTADLAKKNRELAETLEKLTRAQNQLVRAEKMASIGQLVAGIAHEINNPVNAIVNTVAPLDEALQELQGDGEADIDDLRDMIRVIRRGAIRTKDIVSALHNYSRTDDESVVQVDLNRSLDDSLELLRHLLRQSIRVERNYAALRRIRGHAGQLNQVFMNLLTNAAQALATTEAATISVSTSETETAAVVRIRDNGPGIPPTLLPRIFDPFFTTKEVGEGTGLGLSIVHGIVERHGGTIEVDSVVGEGTTFTVSLPFGDEPAATA